MTVTWIVTFRRLIVTSEKLVPIYQRIRRHRIKKTRYVLWFLRKSYIIPKLYIRYVFINKIKPTRNSVHKNI